MRQEKQLLLDEVKEKIEDSKGFIIAAYKDFSAPKAREFRNMIAEAHADFEVVKKRVFIKAAESVGIKLQVEDYKGHIGVIFAKDDAMKLSKVAVNYSEQSDRAIQILGGQIDGQLYGAEDVEAIAKLPSMDEMRAEILGLFEAPMAQTLAVLEAALTSVPFCLEEKAKKTSE